ncbi:MAG: hypothetical protein ACE5HO_20835, partial [bacterium]
KEFKVAPSQGSHFFHNLTSFMVGYFTINEVQNQDFIDWDWLQQRKAVEERKYTRHLHFKTPLTIKMNGHKNKGFILKPEPR